jgi:hypothetical protein
MAKFRCKACSQVHVDNYPPDDTCLKCKMGIIRKIDVLQVYQQALWINTS